MTETTGEIDYVSLLSYPNLEKIAVINGDYIIALAVKFSKARLIDNVIFNTGVGGKQNVSYHDEW